MLNDMLTVGEAAKASGLSAKAVRLYETKGLLPPAQRTTAGYRLYTDDDVAVLRFIRRAKTLGLTLAEIGDILAIRRGGTLPCHHVLTVLDQRIADIDRTITELHQLRRTLTRTRDTAAQDGHGDFCAIIEHAPRPTAGR